MPGRFVLLVKLSRVVPAKKTASQVWGADCRFGRRQGAVFNTLRSLRHRRRHRNRPHRPRK